jgi:hypothetical protein
MRTNGDRYEKKNQEIDLRVQKKRKKELFA